MRKLRPWFLVALGIVIVAAVFWKLWQAHSAHRVALNKALIEAVDDEDLAAVAALLEKGASVRAVDQDSGDRPIQTAARQGNMDIVSALIRAGADVNEQGTGMGAGATPLHMATAWGHVDMVRLLLDHGANVNINTSGFNTPLIRAIAYGKRDAAELLVSRGADIDGKGAVCGDTPLLTAVRFDRVGIARWLLENGADLEAANDLGSTPLGQAVAQGCEEMICLLLEHGAERTFHVAAALGDVEEVRKFLADGADVDLPDKQGWPPLVRAVRNGHTAVVKELIDAGAAVNARRGIALHLAASLGDIEMVRLLLDAGADVNACQPSLFATPLDSALREEHEAAAALLREHGAKTFHELRAAGESEVPSGGR
jgi:ankyrin repeat protein